MTRLTVEDAWIEFKVDLPENKDTHNATTGGQIDYKRGIVTALRNISFDLREGDRLGLMGHNGAGKSTMLRMLSGAYPPSRGRVTSTGSISTLFNTMPGLNVNGTGRENLITSGLRLGFSRRELAGKMDEIIAFAELGDFIDLPVRTYSAGMMTRLGFSIATAVQPEILLLDEGLATGDAQFAQKAQDKMDELVKRSAILVIASHSESLLARMCNRCLLLEHGVVLADGDPEDLLDTYRNTVVIAAQRNDKQYLQRAYALANEMVREGKTPPLELEEQGLRYALKISPNDIEMWNRYKNVLRMQKKPITPDVEISSIIATLILNPKNTENIEKLKVLMDLHSEELPEDLRSRAEHELQSRKIGGS